MTEKTEEPKKDGYAWFVSAAAVIVVGFGLTADAIGKHVMGVSVYGALPPVLPWFIALLMAVAFVLKGLKERGDI
jgi:hypothetical protein